MQQAIIRIFWQEASRFKRLYVLLANACFTPIISGFVGPYIISLLLAKIQAGNAGGIESNLGLLLTYAVTQLYGEFIGWRFNLWMLWTTEISAGRNIHLKIFNHLMNQPMRFHADRFGGSLVSQTNKFVAAFERFWDTMVFNFLPATSSILAAAIILAFVIWQYAIFLFVLSVVFVLVVLFGSRFMADLNTREASASNKQTGHLADSITNILAIKSHGFEDREAKFYKSKVDHWHRQSTNTMWGFLKISSVYALLMSTLNISALTAAIWASQNNTASIAKIYLAVTYTLTVSRYLWEMNSVMRNYNKSIGDATDMAEILNIKPDIADPTSPEKTMIRRGEILFDNVTFYYEDDLNEPVFKNLSLKIKPGEKVGLVGTSGSGKTTITKLILRFMDVSEGAIKVDGQDITKIKQAELRRHIAYVPQEPLLFHRSIAENISYSAPGSDQSTIEATARLANAHEFIKNLPQGYETLVGERGVKLSGGQRQRIAIARAMLKNSPILLLDEATSALDSESEDLIQQALWKLMKNRTALVIAHRLSTIQQMDRIIVLEGGRIIEQGSHKELLKQDGRYAKLWKRQSGGFIK